MATQISELYESVCQALLEDASDLAGDFTQEEFLDLYGETLTAFTGSTGLNKKIFNQPFQVGVGVYPESDLMGELLCAMGQQTFLYESSDFFISNTDPSWPQAVGQPQEYKEDSIESQMIQVVPAPDFPGTQIGVIGSGFGVIGGMYKLSPSTAGYGTVYAGVRLHLTTPGIGFGVISDAFGVVPVIPLDRGFGTPGAISESIKPTPKDCGCPCLKAGFGVIADPLSPEGYGSYAGFSGNPYIDCNNQGFGIIGAMVPSSGNLSMIGTALPYNQSNIDINGWVELIPDSFVMYIKYGILAYLFGSSSELKDEQKAAYCTARFSEGKNLLSAIFGDQEEEEG